MLGLWLRRLWQFWCRIRRVGGFKIEFLEEFGGLGERLLAAFHHDGEWVKRLELKLRRLSKWGKFVIIMVGYDVVIRH